MKLLQIQNVFRGDDINENQLLVIQNFHEDSKDKELKEYLLDLIRELEKEYGQDPNFTLKEYCHNFKILGHTDESLRQKIMSFCRGWIIGNKSKV